MRIPSGVVDQYIYFVAVDETDLKTRETGLNTWTVYRSRNGAAAAAFTTPTINETDSVNMPGVYELLLDEDMTIDAGDQSQEVVVHITHAGMAPVTRVYELYRPTVTAGETITVSGGAITTVTTTTTATNVTTVNGLAANVITATSINADALTAAKIADDVSTEIANKVWDTDATGRQTQGTFGQAIGDPAADTNTIYKAVVTDATGATVGVDVAAVLADTGTDGVVVASLNANVITAASIATNAIGADELADGAITAATFAAGAIDATAIATGAIDADSLAADAATEIANAVWDTDCTARQTQGTFGQAIGDPGADTNTIFKAVVTDATGATVGVDAAAILADTGTDGVVVAAGSKTGYSLTATTGLGNQTADITGSLSGSVGSVTGLTPATVHSDLDDIQAKIGTPAGASVSADVAAVKSDSAAIKTQTDKLTFTVANQIDANIQYVNDVAVTGDGGTGTEWGPA